MHDRKENRSSKTLLMSLQKDGDGELHYMGVLKS